MTTKQLDFVSIPESQLDQNDDLGKFNFGKAGKVVGVLNGGINAFNGIHGIGQKFGLWDTDSEGINVVSTSESQLDQDDDLGKFNFGKAGKVVGVLNGGIDAFNGIHGIGQKFGLWDTDSEGAEVSGESTIDAGSPKQSTSAFDALTGSDLPPDAGSKVSASETNDDLGLAPLIKFGAKVYMWGKAGGAWDIDSDNGIVADQLVNNGSNQVSNFESFFMQDGDSLMAPADALFAEAASITDFVTGQSGVQESGMDGLVAAGPLDAVTVDEPRNNDF